MGEIDATQHSWGWQVEKKKTISCFYLTELRLFNKLVTVFNKNGKERDLDETFNLDSQVLMQLGTF